MSEVKISKENLIKCYNEADKATKNTLETIFGKDMFQPKNIIERVKTFSDAVKELGENHPYVVAYKELLKTITRDEHTINAVGRDVVAYLQLRIIVAALNEGWIPPQDCKTDVWYCWHWLYTKSELDNMSDNEKAESHILDITGKYRGRSCGFVSVVSSYAPSSSDITVCSRLCFKTRELAEYCGTQFINLWAEFQLI